jgi:hypothetical protein
MGLNFLRDYVIMREGTGLKVVYKEKIRGRDHKVRWCPQTTIIEVFVVLTCCLLNKHTLFSF